MRSGYTVYFKRHFCTKNGLDIEHALASLPPEITAIKAS